jgi:hypothetical protein
MRSLLKIQEVKMGTKSILENKSSLSTLISPVSPPASACSSDFSGFHLPPVTTRIYPYSHFSGNNNEYRRKNRGSSTASSSRCEGAPHGVLGAFFWFALGTFIAVLGIFIAKNVFQWDFLLIPKLENIEANSSHGQRVHSVISSNTDPMITSPQSRNNGTFISEYNNRSSSTSDNEEIKCMSAACMTAAARILHRIDSQTNACDDFYQFSCGSFIAHNEIPDDSFQRSTLQEMQESILVDIKSKL